MCEYRAQMNQIRLSPSRVSDFNNCPQLYKYRAIDQLPEAISLDAQRGTLVHSVLDDLFDSNQGERTIEKAISLVPQLWKKQIEQLPELALLISNEQEWMDRVDSLLKTYFSLEEPNSFEATYRELHVEMNLSQEIYLHGYVDRLDIAPNGQVRIVDYKTGKSPKPGWEEKALFQLRIYALIYWRNTGVIPNLLKLMYLGNGQTIKSIPNMAQLEKTEQVLIDIATAIDEALESNVWKPKPSRLCDWCSFKPICPAFTS